VAAPEPAPGSTLAEETRLLSRARTDLLEGQPEQALERLGEHARRFPAGLLAEERQALRAVALCEAGHDADGEAAARSFLREHPHAALAQRVRSACLAE
jgi:outer membrane protein assembly factor BamD (BamD/ComL family)